MPKHRRVSSHGWNRKRAFRLGQAHPGDGTFAHEGKTVLVLSDELCQQLADGTIDVEDTDEGPRLRLQ